MYLFLELKKKKPRRSVLVHMVFLITGREPQSKEAAMEE